MELVSSRRPDRRSNLRAIRDVLRLTATEEALASHSPINKGKQVTTRKSAVAVAVVADREKLDRVRLRHRMSPQDAGHPNAAPPKSTKTKKMSSKACLARNEDTTRRLNRLQVEPLHPQSLLIARVAIVRVEAVAAAAVVARSARHSSRHLLLDPKPLHLTVTISKTKTQVLSHLPRRAVVSLPRPRKRMWN